MPNKSIQSVARYDRVYRRGHLDKVHTSTVKLTGDMLVRNDHGDVEVVPTFSVYADGHLHLEGVQLDTAKFVASLLVGLGVSR